MASFGVRLKNVHGFAMLLALNTYLTFYIKNMYTGVGKDTFSNCTISWNKFFQQQNL